MFGIVLLAASTLLHLYVFARARGLLTLPASRRVLVAATVFLWLLVVGARFLRSPTPLGRALDLAGMNWLATIFLIATALLFADLLTGFGWLLPRLARPARVLALAAGAALGVFAAVQGLRAPTVEHYEVRLPGLPPELDGAVLVAASDLHLGFQLGPEWLAARLQQIGELDPDLVVLVGDVFEGRQVSRYDWTPGLKTLSPPLGTWAVLGNHDLFEGGTASVRALEQAGVRVLRNRWEQVLPGLVLAGVDDLTMHQRRGLGGDPVAQALTGRAPGATILLSHTPWRAGDAARAGAGLMLSGHTHAGQVWPFGYLVGLRYPLLEGRYEVEGMTVVVGRGTGTWGPRMRLWRRAELSRVTLRSAQPMAVGGSSGR